MKDVSPLKTGLGLMRIHLHPKASWRAVLIAFLTSVLWVFCHLSHLLNRDNQLVQITKNGLQSNSAYFVRIGNQLGINYFSGYYPIPSSPARATNSYPPRQLQFALRTSF